MLKHMIPALLVMAALNCATASERQWSGTIVDLRNNQAVAGSEIYGGMPGRVDLTPKAISAANGSFLAAYPDNLSKLDCYGLRVTTADYLTYVEYRKRPGAVTVALTPRWAHIQGRVTDAATGQALAGIQVVTGQPGVYRSGDMFRTLTDADGRYHLRIPAYEAKTQCSYAGLDAMPNREYAAKLAKEQPRVIGDYWFEANYSPSGNAKSYRSISTKDPQKAIPLLSSVTPDIVTIVNFQLPRRDAEAGAATDFTTVIAPQNPTQETAQADGPCPQLLERIDSLIRSNEAMLRELKELRALAAGK